MGRAKIVKRVQNRFTRPRSADGKPIKGLFIRSGSYYVGYSKNGRWYLPRLKAKSLEAALVEREILLRDQKILSRFEKQLPKEPKLKQLDQLHSDSRKLAQSVSQTKELLSHRENRALLDEAEWMTARAAELIFAAWKTSRT